MDITIIEQPELRVAGIRHIGPYMEIGRELGRLAGQLKGAPPSGAQMIAVYHDDPETTAPAQLRSDAAITLPGHTASPLGLIEQRVPAGRYAKGTHLGSYSGLPATWSAIRQWAIDNGHRPANPSYEIYVNNPMTAKEPDLITEIYVRVG